jgi:hypothetical protein
MEAAASIGEIHDVVRVFEDLGILTRAADGRLRFAHERTQEYFLAKSLELPECPFSLRTPEGINRVLKAFDERHLLIAAIRTHFLFEPTTRFSVLTDVIAKPPGLSDTGAELRLLAFAKELTVDLACDSPQDFRAWFQRSKDSVIALEAGDSQLQTRADAVERHWRAMIQAAAHLPDSNSLSVLTEAARTGTVLARSEADIYATDKVVRLLFQHGVPPDLLRDADLGNYYADPAMPRLRRLGRLLGLMSQIGPDNTHPSEYTTIRERASAACAATLGEEPVTDEEIAWFAEFFYAERDRYVFNGNLEGMMRFFRNPMRGSFLPILDRLEQGGVLRHEDIEILRPYLSDIYQDLEFQLGNFLFIFSAANDLATTKALWEEHFDSFSNLTPPETVDFFQAAGVYMYAVNGYPYDGLLDRHIDRILSDCPKIIEHEPGRERGYARGFRDEFDMVFEDGFNPIASYATLLPSESRKGLRWHEYVSDAGNRPFALPVFAHHLSEALQLGETRKALRVLHALGQFTMLWPREGLWNMVGPIQHQHPTIHRAAVRILAEAYNRYPVESLRFFAQSGITISPGDLRDIRARIDPRIGRRQFEGLQWARVLHFLLSFEGARARLFEVLRQMYKASSALDAAHSVAVAFGWTKNNPSK